MDKRILLVLAALFLLAQGVFRVVMVPLWANYDEATHFEYMRYVVTNRSLPTGADSDPAIARAIADTYGPDTPIGNCYALEVTPCFFSGEQNGEVPLYYIVQGVGQLPLAGAGIMAQVMMARAVSLLMLFATVALAYATTRLVLPGYPLVQIGVVWVMVLLFPFVDAMTGINNDIAANLAASFFIYAWVRATTADRKQWVNWLLVVVAVGAALLAKSSAWLVVPFVVLGLLIYLVPWNRTLMIGVGVLAVVALPLVVVIGPTGGPIIRPALNTLIAGVIPIDPNAQLAPFYLPGSGPYYGRVVRWLFTSFWASFGIGHPAFPQPGWVAVYAALTLTAGLGWLVGWRRVPLRREHVIFFVVIAVSAFAMNFWRASPYGASFVYLPAARHMTIAIIPIMILFVGGLRLWFPADVTAPPLAWRVSLAALLLLLFALGAWSFINVQVPVYAAWPVP